VATDVEPNWDAGELAVRIAYDRVAVDYERTLAGELDHRPVDRALLGAFVDTLPAGTGPVLDVGCGPGRIIDHLRRLGERPAGLDLSPGMVRVARQRHPDLDLRIGSMTALPWPAGSARGVLAWYSLIHLPADGRIAAYTEFARVLVPGGLLLAAFQVGTDRRHITQGYGHQVDLVAYRLDPDEVGAAVRAAGFEVVATLVRAPSADPFPERTRQGFVLARRT
jgi:SAM-dependent methyltransferase